MRFISMTRRLGVTQPGRLQTGIPFARQVGRKLRQIRSSAPIEAALAHASSQPRGWSSLICSRACRLGSASFKPVDHRFAGRSGRLRPSCPPRPQRAQTARPLPARPVIERKRLPELVSSQLRYIAEPRTMCRMAPFAEKDELLVPPRYATGIRPRTRAKKVSFIARQCEAALQVVIASEAVVRLALPCPVNPRQTTAQPSIPAPGEALPAELRSSQPVMSGRSHGERSVRLDRTRQSRDEMRDVSFRPSKQQVVHPGN